MAKLNTEKEGEKMAKVLKGYIDKEIKKRTPKELSSQFKKDIKRGKILKPKMAKKIGKSTIKTIAKAGLKKIGPVATVLTAAEIAKGAARGAKKVGKSMKAKSACQKRGGVYKKGFCITSKSIKAKSLKKK